MGCWVKYGEHRLQASRSRKSGTALVSTFNFQIPNPFHPIFPVEYPYSFHARFLPALPPPAVGRAPHLCPTFNFQIPNPFHPIFPVEYPYSFHARFLPVVGRAPYCARHPSLNLIYNNSMPRYHRYYLPGHPVFITNVTNNRASNLSSRQDIELFWRSVRETQTRISFSISAFVILPDHFHWLLELPEESPDFSAVIKLFKWKFTKGYQLIHAVEEGFTPWQKRFWDHVIRDEQDLENHLDYIHWNPVRHGFVQSPEEWEHSSYKEWEKKGYYGNGWGEDEEPAGIRELRYE